jgi:hypothetical protein
MPYRSGLCLLVLLLSMAGCSRVPVDRAADAGGNRVAAPAAPIPVETPAPPAAAPARGPSRVAVVVNGIEILEPEIKALASAEAFSCQEALKLTVQAEVVAQEARRSRLIPDLSGDRLALARRYLEEVYSEQALCAQISPRQIKDFYELSYQPDWPADIYKGEIVELRCCRSTQAACPAEEVAACKATHGKLLAELPQVRRRWLQEGKPPDVSSLLPSFPGLVSTDFAFIVWPGIALEKQKRLTLFDLPTLRTIMAMKEGEVSKPLESSLGYHLVKLTRFRPAITAQTEEFASQARTLLCKERVERTRNETVNRLVEAAIIEKKSGTCP